VLWLVCCFWGDEEAEYSWGSAANAALNETSDPATASGRRGSLTARGAAAAAASAAQAALSSRPSATEDVGRITVQLAPSQVHSRTQGMAGHRAIIAASRRSTTGGDPDLHPGPI
jgi:hypothetical protein